MMVLVFLRLINVKAITVHRPWGYAIAHLGKNVENRTWKCWLQPGELLAIHNGQRWSSDAVQYVHDIVYDAGMNPEEDPAGAIIAVARFAGNLTESDSPWFMGPIGWLLEDVTPIEPVYISGKQGLWTVPDDVLVTVYGGLLKAGSHIGCEPSPINVGSKWINTSYYPARLMSWGGGGEWCVTDDVPLS